VTVASGKMLDGAQRLRNPLAIDDVLHAAAEHLRAARHHLADPATLPPSFRN